MLAPHGVSTDTTGEGAYHSAGLNVLASSLAFSDTSRWECGVLHYSPAKWKSRFPTQPLLAWVEVHLQFFVLFSVVFGWSRIVII